MDALAVIERAKELGVTLTVDGDYINATPKSRVTPELADQVREHKAEVLVQLRRRGYYLRRPNDAKAGDAEIAEAEQAIEREGFVMLWSNVLKDLVAYTRSDEDRAKVPAGIVTYSMAELRQLFGPTGDKKPGAPKLRLIHEAKKLGARVVPQDDGGQPC